MTESRSFLRASVALSLIVQMGCSDDGPSWNVPGSDGGLDGGGESLTSSSTPSDAERPDASMGMSESTDGITVSFGSQSNATSTSSEADASVGSSAETTEEQTSGVSESDASVPTIGETVSTEASDTTQMTTETSSEPELTTDVTSEPAATCDGGSCEPLTDAATPSVSICGYEIDESKGIALSDVLPAYLAGQDGGVADGGGESTCYPPCIAALLAACPVVSECTPQSYVEACWANGVSQTLEFIESEDLMTVVETAYIQDAPCIRGESALDSVNETHTLTWWDGTGAQVATGVWEDNELFVTCGYDEQVYLADPYACPWLGEAVYNQVDCY